MLFASYYIASPIKTVETKFRGVHYSLIRICSTGSITGVPIDPNEPFVPSLEIGVDGATVTDLGSTNGTSINGERIAGPRHATSGDVIAFGNTQMRLEARD